MRIKSKAFNTEPNVHSSDTLPLDSINQFIKESSTIILLPGGPGADHSIYKDQIDQLINLANLIIFDPRGCGCSTISNSYEYHMDVYIDDIEEIRKFFDLKNFILLGTSYGSMVAQGYAVRHKSSFLKGLILVAGASNYTFIDTAKSILNNIGSPQQNEMFAKLLDGNMHSDDDMREYFKTMAPLYSVKAAPSITNPSSETDFHSAKKNIRYNYEAALAGFGPIGFLHKFDWRPQLINVKIPVRIVVGDKDWMNDKAHAFEVQKLYHDCRVEVISNSGHFVWTDQREAYFSVVSSFITEITMIPEITSSP